MSGMDDLIKIRGRFNFIAESEVLCTDHTWWVAVDKGLATHQDSNLFIVFDLIILPWNLVQAILNTYGTYNTVLFITQRN